MLTLLAVSDQKEESLLRLLESRGDEVRRTVDAVISCGDLTASYVELIASLTNKIVYYVVGNHHTEENSAEERDETGPGGPFSAGAFAGPEIVSHGIPGGVNIHRQHIVLERLRLVGFEGSPWYNGEDRQYTEKEMMRASRAVSRTLWLSDAAARIIPRPHTPLIVVSHTPIAGIGDEKRPGASRIRLFREFMEHQRPVLWLYGHVHLQHYSQNAVFREGATTAVNCFGYKFIRIADDGTVQVTFDFGGLR